MFARTLRRRAKKHGVTRKNGMEKISVVSLEPARTGYQVPGICYVCPPILCRQAAYASNSTSIAHNKHSLEKTSCIFILFFPFFLSFSLVVVAKTSLSRARARATGTSPHLHPHLRLHLHPHVHLLSACILYLHPHLHLHLHLSPGRRPCGDADLCYDFTHIEKVSHSVTSVTQTITQSVKSVSQEEGS